MGNSTIFFNPYVPQYNSDGYSEVSHFQNLRFLNFQALDPKTVIGSKTKIS